MADKSRAAREGVWHTNELAVRVVMEKSRSGSTPAEIARSSELGLRTVREILRAKQRAVREISERVGKPRSKGGILVRNAARAATLLDEGTQRRLAPKLVGLDLRAGHALVRAAEDRAGLKRRGRKPRAGPTEREIRERLERLEAAVLERLEQLASEPADSMTETCNAVVGYFRGSLSLDELFGQSPPTPR